MKIVITGVAGFIGANLAERLLRDGHRVIGIDNLAYGLRSNIPEGVEFHQLDIREKEIYPLFTGTDAVFHFAAKNCIADCQADPVETADINVRGTVNVFEAARLSGVRKVIYAESSAIYEGAKTYPTPETDEAPESFYISVNLVRALEYAKEAGAKIFGIVGRDGGFTAQVADACVVVPTVNPETVTAHTEAFQAVIWHLIVSHPSMKVAEMKWESVK